MPIGFWKRCPSDLDRIIAAWSSLDPITIRMICQNVLICGKTGSGKSSGAGDYLLRALVRYRNTAGLWLASKPEDYDYALRLFREEGRAKDLDILEPGGANRFNVLDYERERGADAHDLTQACMTFQETITRAQGGGQFSGDGAKWEALERMMLYNAIRVILLATQGRQIDAWSIQCFITGAAQSLAETADEAWQASYHAQMLGRARAHAVHMGASHDFELTEQYWLYQLPRMNDRTRTSIEAGVLATTHAMNTGTARELLGTNTTVSPLRQEQKRRWLLVNAPVVPGDLTSVAINTAVKYSFQRHVLKRKAKPDDPLMCIFSDEFQKLANSYDAMFLAECRSHKGSLIALTQSVHAMYANLHGHGGEHQTDALLTNFGHVVVHTLGDHSSAKKWSDLLGQRRETFISATLQPDGNDLFDLMMGRTHASVSASSRYEPVLQPAVFLRGLRCGGPAHAHMVDGVVIRSGEPFAANGENYVVASFRQR